MFSTGDAILRMLAFLIALLVAHLPVVIVSRRALPRSEALVLGLYSATTLSLIVAMIDVAVTKGVMQVTEASILVVSGVASVPLLPVIASKILNRTGTAIRLSVSHNRGAL